MKGLIMNADRKIEYVDQPEAILKPGHVIINVAGCGICGSDMHVYRGSESSWHFPVLFGHEFAGTITAVADDVKDFMIGDIVTVEPMTYCGTCEMCKKKRYNLCPNVLMYGAELPGGFAKQIAVDYRYLIKVPQGVTATQAVITEPLATVIHGFNRLKQQEYDNIVIFGAGAIGLLAASVALTKAKRVAVIDVVSSRLETALEIGVNLTVNSKEEKVEEAIMQMTHGEKVDLCIDCAGLSEVRKQCFQLISPGGELLFIAMGHDFTEVNFRQIVSKELTVCGCQCHYMSDFEKALTMLKNGVIPYEKIVTTYPLEEGLNVFEKMKNGEQMGIKVILVPEQEVT